MEVRTAAFHPVFMGPWPSNASQGRLKKIGCSAGDLQLLAANEAFAVQVLEVRREMKWDINRVHVRAGAIALGRPVGAGGTRRLVTPVRDRVQRYVCPGLASLCLGGDQASAMAVERVQ